MLSTLLFTAAHFGAPGSDNAGSKDVLWLPLGDSITWGCTGPTVQDCHGIQPNDHVGGSGYRIPLALALSEPPCGGCPMTGGGWNISTMGTLKTGPSYTPTQWHYHEGHPGWQINMVDNILNKSLATSPQKPDLITIHLGTNDCNANVNITTMAARMDSLLDHIFAEVPEAQVFLADVVGTGMFFQGCIEEFNKVVPGIVDAHAKAGQKLYFVPMFNETRICGGPGADFGLCGGHQIHPTAAGYPRMASAFARTILQKFEI